MNRNYPPVSFYFSVDFLDLGNNDIDIRFQSVSGLNIDIETETIKEGGENRFQHKLPVRTKYADLTLKRGLIKQQDSKVMKWCLDAFTNYDIKPVNLLIKLLNETDQPLMKWNVKHVWPKKWSVSDFNAEQSAFAIETLELYYNFFTIE